ncbi:MAG: hypothetical protein M0R46_04265 [Candidatus Muirbacterium halophilum]|nr:hypothetical protein [Candidatus Muirbacterium halophilum]MCK9475108.1 hypothetical protein [Candidatus Muirbacterium halophilum]
MNKVNIFLLIFLIFGGVLVYFLYFNAEIFPELNNYEKIEVFLNSKEIKDENIISKLKETVFLIRNISEKDESQRYGINENSDKVKFVVEGKEYIVITGNINPHNSGVYVFFNNKIYLFSKSLKDIIVEYNKGGKDD